MKGLDVFCPDILNQCFGYLDTETLLSIVKCQDMSYDIIDAVLPHLNNIWFSNNGWGLKYGQYHVYDFDEFFEIHQKIQEKGRVIPLRFSYFYVSLDSMYIALDQINRIYNNQPELELNFTTLSLDSQCLAALMNDSIRTKVTHLSFKCFYSGTINLGNFINLRQFRGESITVAINHDHSSLKRLDLEMGCCILAFPVGLTELFIKKYTRVAFDAPQPPLSKLRKLAIDGHLAGMNGREVRKLFCNKFLEQFSITGSPQSNYEDSYPSMLALKHLGFKGNIDDSLPRLLDSIHAVDGNVMADISIFSNLSTLEIHSPKSKLDSLILPRSLRKLTINSASNPGVERIKFPENLVELRLNDCGIISMRGINLPNTLVKLSLDENKLSEFYYFLPSCQYLLLSSNKLHTVEVKAPNLEYLDLGSNELVTLPDLPNTLRCLQVTSNDLNLDDFKPLPPRLRQFIFHFAGGATGTLKDYTFPSSLEYVDLGGIPSISGVKFASGSKLKDLNLSGSGMDAISDKNISLPDGIKILDLFGNNLQTLDKLRLPDSLEYLNLGRNNLRSFEPGLKLQTLELEYNPICSNLVVPDHLDLRSVDLSNVGLKNHDLGQLARAKKLVELTLGEAENIIFNDVPPSLQVLKYWGHLENTDFILQPKKEDAFNIYWKRK
ncbi:uncharacterized protein PRCAT00006284001 [Priceomyces carsonii]|uniref:uncharacterized protein n=1 Tax=Priceomyces carsonii TaxID=28549 RepID=UPI002EDAA239|nr:unnamed protein product [Priceomyces carsonii]